MTAKLCTTKELAVRFAVHPKTVSKWARCNVIPVIRINQRCVRFDIERCDEAMGRRNRLAGFSCVAALLSITLTSFFLVMGATKWQQGDNNRGRLLNGIEEVRGSNPLGSTSFVLANRLLRKLLATLSRAMSWEHLGVAWSF